MTVSSKYQITLPMDMVRALGLKGGDKLDAELINSRIVLFPKPPSYTDYFVGRMKGFWGSKKEIDHYIAEQRGSWEHSEWREQVEDLLATDENARKMVAVLREQPNHLATEDDFKKALPLLNGDQLKKTREKLTELGAIRELESPEGWKTHSCVYRLVHEFAEA
ncbi:MAG: AbrB/MazE/SpoVT family DNA-binding domain-containing protein [Chloroflexi bacterium]|nr:AbrB/MazE/SpoVT family DNA-binding domain-containing protein [Chloroflexota bacterium]